MENPFNLTRFVEAQAPVIDTVRAELAAGDKRTHWMWFVFPQLAGLARSSTAAFFAITGLEEARAYLAHPVLGPRLLECTALVTAVQGRTAQQIFGAPDDLKFRSSMTLFARATSNPGPFKAALTRYFAGQPDPATLTLLSVDLSSPPHLRERSR
ncbi:MAG: DUF1810 domain-containing protein [Phenylobacterium sp.]|nr:DUF1810 domain-containing protein [Phenylobacterium sp.]